MRPLDIRKLIESLIANKSEIDHSNWIQVGKISPEDNLKRRALVAKSAERNRQMQSLQSRVVALVAASKADADEWWSEIHKKYGLPDGIYHIEDDGRILTEPIGK